MGTLSLPMLGTPRAWSTNEDRNLHWGKRYEVLEHWKRTAQVTFGQWKIRTKWKGHFPYTIVQLELVFPAKRRDGMPNTTRRDPHNYCGTVVKAVIDGLVLAKAFPDDTPEYVGHRESILRLTDTDPPVMKLWCAPGTEPWET